MELRAASRDSALRANVGHKKVSKRCLETPLRALDLKALARKFLA